MLTLFPVFLAGWFAAHLLVKRAMSAGLCLALGMALTIFTSAVAAAFSAPMVVLKLLPWVLAIAAGVALMSTSNKKNSTLRSLLHLPTSSRFGRVVVIILQVTCLLALWRLVHCMGVPVVMYDVLSYHIPLARHLYEPGGAAKLFWEPDTFYGMLPLGATILQAPFVADSAGGANGIGLHLLVLASVLGCASCAARIAGWFGARATGRWLAVALVLLHPMVADTVLKALADPLTALLALAAVEVLLLAGSRRGVPFHLILAGILAGSAVTTKFSALGIVVAALGAGGLVLLGTVYTQRRGWKLPMRVLASWTLFGVGVLVVMTPWLVRSQILGGNPLFPFAGENHLWEKTQAAFVLGVHGPLVPLSGPWFQGFIGKLGVLGYTVPGIPFSLLLLAVLAFASARLRTAGLLWTTALLGYMAWLGMEHNPTRFLLPSALLLVPAVAVATDRLPRLAKHHTMAVLVTLALAVVTTGKEIRQVFHFDAVYLPSTRGDLRGPYLGESLMQIVNVAEDSTPSGGKVLLFFEARPSLFAVTTESRSVWDKAVYTEDLIASSDAADFARRLHMRGITGIFVNEFEWGRMLDFYANDQRQGLPPRMGNVGIFASLPNSAIIQALADWPPHRFAKLDERSLTILHAFLLSRRQGTIVANPAGKSAEIWYAPIPFNALPRDIK